MAANPDFDFRKRLGGVVEQVEQAILEGFRQAVPNDPPVRVRIYLWGPHDGAHQNTVCPTAVGLRVSDIVVRWAGRNVERWWQTTFDREGEHDGMFVLRTEPRAFACYLAERAILSRITNNDTDYERALARFMLGVPINEKEQLFEYIEWSEKTQQPADNLSATTSEGET